MLTGIAWMVGMRWVVKLLGLFNTAILARLLSPGDFGIMAMSMVAVELVLVAVDGDFDMAVIRHSQGGKEFDDSAWTAKICAGIAAGVVLLALAPVAARIMGDERLSLVVALGGLRAFILGFENMGAAHFRRNLDFKGEFRYGLAQRLASLVATLALAFAFRDYRALAFSGPAAALVTVGLSYMLIAYRPSFSRRHWRELWAFSRWQVLFNLARMAAERGDQAVIGRLAGVAAAGQYYVALDTALTPTREIILPAGRALMPNYARMAHDRDCLRQNFAQALGAAAMAALPMGVGLALTAADVVPLLLGPQWLDAVPFFRWLGIFGALEGLWLMLDPLLVAAGRERSLALGNVLFALCMMAAVAAAGWLGGAAWVPAARVAVMALTLAGMFAALAAWGWVDWSGLAACLIRPITACAIMAASLWEMEGLVKIPVGVVVYGGALWIMGIRPPVQLWRGAK